MFVAFATHYFISSFQISTMKKIQTALRYQAGSRYQIGRSSQMLCKLIGSTNGGKGCVITVLDDIFHSDCLFIWF